MKIKERKGKRKRRKRRKRRKEKKRKREVGDAAGIWLDEPEKMSLRR